jgi:hypothetical protein
VHRAFANLLLLSGSILLCLIVAEGVVRLLDDLPLFATPQPLPIGSHAAISHFDEVPMAAGVQRDWFFRMPPPPPNRTRTPEQWQRWYDDVERAAAEHGNAFRGIDMLKACNSVRSAIPAPTPSSPPPPAGSMSTTRRTARPSRPTASCPTPPSPTR